MHYVALATDYDGTIAQDGVVDEATIGALERLRAAARRIVLVTGRELADLQRVMPRLDLFDRVVAENGALLYRPETREERMLAGPPPAAFVERLREDGVSPLSVGRVIVATWEPNETTVLAAIRDLGLGLQVIFNKGAVMVLPAGVSKDSGLRAALAELELWPRNVVATGDAENDFAFFDLCGLPVAVANALPMLKERAALVTKGARGAGVAELIGRWLDDDLAALDMGNPRQSVRLADPQEGSGSPALDLVPARENLLLVGASGGGKSTLTTGLLERLAAARFQVCIIDPEGDYEKLEGAVSIGTPKQAPGVEAVSALLRKTDRSVAVNLLGVKLQDRPKYFSELLPELLALRADLGRPHFVVADEAHHLLPAEADAGAAQLGPELKGMMFVSVRPQALAPQVTQCADRIIAVGAETAAALRAFCAARDLPEADAPNEVPTGELLTLSVGDPAPRRMAMIPGEGARRRHLRKYAEGRLGDDRAFFFRGPQGKLNLRAANLISFLDLADGVDAETWEFHRGRGDYSRWIGSSIKDRDLSEAVAAAERSGDAADEARAAIRRAVEERYTLPE